MFGVLARAQTDRERSKAGKLVAAERIYAD